MRGQCPLVVLPCRHQPFQLRFRPRRPRLLQPHPRLSKDIRGKYSDWRLWKLTPIIYAHIAKTYCEIPCKRLVDIVFVKYVSIDSSKVCVIYFFLPLVNVVMKNLSTYKASSDFCIQFYFVSCYSN